MKMDVIANNLANVNTIAYKRARANTEDFFYQQIKLPGAQDAFNNYAPTGLAIGLGSRVQGTQTIFQQGAFDITNRQLDVAIEGDGFFQVIDPSTNNFLYTAPEISRSTPTGCWWSVLRIPAGCFSRRSRFRSIPRAS